MNKITDKIRIGTLGELLVQLRLLEHNVQAAPPIKDSGNDLITIRGQVFRAIQVKTTTGEEYSKANLPEMYHILAVVQLVDDQDRIYLDRSPVFLIPRDKVQGASTRIDSLDVFRMTPSHVDSLFSR
jgi:hypothetical protein